MGAADEFHFVWKRMNGDFILRARVELLGKGVDPHRKMGLIVRGGPDADAPYADAAVHGDGLTSLQFRKTKGAITEQIVADVKGADVIQLERKGTTYTFSAARFGDPFTVTRVATCPGRRGPGRVVPLLAQPRCRGAGRLPGRADHPARDATASCLTAITSAATWRCSTSKRAAASSPQLAPSPSRRRTGRRTAGADLQHERPG